MSKINTTRAPAPADKKLPVVAPRPDFATLDRKELGYVSKGVVQNIVATLGHDSGQTIVQVDLADTANALTASKQILHDAIAMPARIEAVKKVERVVLYNAIGTSALTLTLDDMKAVLESAMVAYKGAGFTDNTIAARKSEMLKLITYAAGNPLAYRYLLTRALAWPERGVVSSHFATLIGKARDEGLTDANVVKKAKPVLDLVWNGAKKAKAERKASLEGKADAAANFTPESAPEPKPEPVAEVVSGDVSARSEGMIEEPAPEPVAEPVAARIDVPAAPEPAKPENLEGRALLVRMKHSVDPYRAMIENLPTDIAVTVETLLVQLDTALRDAAPVTASKPAGIATSGRIKLPLAAARKA